ncbi:unnamed protein product [Phytophthora lilii]|uniref:Unnamed protein product n=1 Tax=Phytophthora lilii TaxID=2077276 RepID=A0A9W6TGA1_9STRA|nr:unnamed protein product [Phytophthora lilii]
MEKEKEEKEKEEKETGSQEEEKSGKGTEESHQLPFGLEGRTREQVQIKQEVAPFSEDEQTTGGDTLQEVGEAESPLKLSLMDSSEEDEPLGLEPEADESPMELEADLDETPMELEVPDSDSDTDFTPFQERLKKLQKANAATQLIEFPSVVEQFRDYLFKEKHMTVAELDGYLFAHKRITEEEVDEMGRAIETLISVGMNLATRPKIKLALFDLLAAVEQLEQTLGALPVSLKS